MQPEELARDRARVLLEQLQEELGYGWQSELARRTGVHQTTISKIRNRDRGAGLKSIRRIGRALGIQERFFSDAALGSHPDYRHYLVGTVEGRRGREVVVEWLASPDGQVVSDEDAEALLSIDWGGIDPTPAMVRGIWLERVAQRARRAPPTPPAEPVEIGNKRRLPPKKKR